MFKLFLGTLYIVICPESDARVVRTISSWPSWSWVGLLGAALCTECRVSLWLGRLLDWIPPGTVPMAVFSVPRLRLMEQLLTGPLPAESRAGALRGQHGSTPCPLTWPR